MTASKEKKTFLILIMACANTAVYGVPYLKDMFYELMKAALHINNTQIGVLCSIYGTVAVVGYIVGGMLADRISAKNLIGFSGILSGILCFYLLTDPSYKMMCVVFALMAIASVLTFYPAAMKAVSAIGGNEKQGSMFGLFYLTSSIFGMMISGISVLIVAKVLNERIAFGAIVGIYGIVNLFCAGAVCKLMDEEPDRVERTENQIRNLRQTLKSGTIWMLIGIVFANYVLNCMAVYLNTYMMKVLCLPKQWVYIFSIIRIYIIVLLVAPVVGRLADMIKSSIKVIEMCFLISSVCLLFLLVFYEKKGL